MQCLTPRGAVATQRRMVVCVCVCVCTHMCAVPSRAQHLGVPLFCKIFPEGIASPAGRGFTYRSHVDDRGTAVPSGDFMCPRPCTARIGSLSSILTAKPAKWCGHSVCFHVCWLHCTRIVAAAAAAPFSG
ncbi:hypothetical protein LZ32DRAFT_346403 [Colletotrichum eremochloae]|nr:hypothetical protein LZ32DRAFT_346403 [Colletotrichum eremochloae]